MNGSMVGFPAKVAALFFEREESSKARSMAPESFQYLPAVG